MARYLKYYAKENLRHKDATTQKTNFKTCVAMANALFSHFNVPEIPIRAVTKKDRIRSVKSWYRSKPDDRQIVLHPNMLDPLTVAHEVAHYVHDMRFRARKMAGSTRPRGRWHGSEHRTYTDAGISKLKGNPRYTKLFGPQTDLKAFEDLKKECNLSGPAPVDPVLKFFEALPTSLHCPKCDCRKAKSSFGVRVMKRDSLNRPVVIRRQSYCKDCR